jgi:predicted alpha/beta hydrolase family esterase
MPKQVLFIQGAGAGAYEEDAKLVESLRGALGSSYEVAYPALPNEADAGYKDWIQFVDKALAEVSEQVILVAHSMGSSVLLKCLSELKTKKSVAGVFLMAAPFWGDGGWRYAGYEGLELPDDLAAKLPQGAPVFLYQCRDDDTVSYDHLSLYQKLLPHATTRSLDEGGHQFNNDLAVVAQDIKGLTS